MSNKVLVITGPTASGKSGMAVRMAEMLDGEVVSADSMQVYRYMDIGTAKPTAEEKRGIPHHMLDVVTPFESYSVASYVEEASRWVDDILSRGKVPVITGGTGLYIDSLIAGRSFAPRQEDGGLREELNNEYDMLGGGEMLKRLGLSDPVSAARLHPNDRKRIVRALEAAEFGIAISGHDEETRRQPPRYEAKYIVLGYSTREMLYDRINARVDSMFSCGLADEVRDLLSMGLDEKYTAMQAIGYKETAAALKGLCTMDEAAEAIKRGSRRYAKRQISWCRRYADALRIDWDENSSFADALRKSQMMWQEIQTEDMK